MGDAHEDGHGEVPRRGRARRGVERRRRAAGRRRSARDEPLAEQLHVQLLIADFNDRHGEINNRTTAQHLLINLNISAAGVVAAAAVTADEPDLFLLVAPICSALGMLWANHDRTIKQIGWYLEDHVLPVVQDRDASLWRWEIARLDYLTNRGLRWGFRFPVLLTFVGPPVVALVYSFNRYVLSGTVARGGVFALAALVTAVAGVLLASRADEKRRRGARRVSGRDPGEQAGCHAGDERVR